MKILLIHPNKFAHRYVSIGISMVSAVLKQAGNEVLFFDTSRFKENDSADYSDGSVQKMEHALQFKPAELPRIKKSDEAVMPALHSRIKSFRPDLIGFSATSSEFPYLAKIVRDIKKYRIPTIAGGIHATVFPMDALRIDGIDMALVGEGEEAILELTNALQSGRSRSDIRNIYFKNKNRIIKNDIRPYIRNLDSLPFMDMDIFDKYHHIGAYHGDLVTYARIETGRGCPYRCNYCINEQLNNKIYGHEKKHIRNKSPRRVTEELKFIDNKIRFDIVRFVDETFTTYSIEWLKEFVDLYKSEIDKPMVIATHPNRVTPEKMEVLREAHKDIQVTMGVESGNERIRAEVLGRPVSDRSILRAFSICHELGFSTASFNMIGLPGETRDDFLKTIELNVEVGVQTPILSYFYPFTGCKLRDVCIKEGYLSDELHETDYSISSPMKLPYFPSEEIEGLKRTFVMYVKMDKSLYPEIKKAEKDDAAFHRLAELYKNQAGV
ncbi:B12-binding domain-containing radical SAM protein [Candidatus Omnitrophota bacterium]